MILIKEAIVELPADWQGVEDDRAVELLYDPEYRVFEVKYYLGSGRNISTTDADSAVKHFNALVKKAREVGNNVRIE